MREVVLNNECETYVYEQQLGATNENEIVNSVLPFSDGDIFLAGSVSGANTNSEGLLIKMNKQGNRVWVKRYANSDFHISFKKITRAADGNIAIIGSSVQLSTQKHFITIMKLTSEGNTGWTRHFASSNPNAIVEGMDITTLENGGLAFAGDDKANIICGITDFNGHLGWNKILHVADSATAIGLDKAQDENAIHISATCKTNNQQSGMVMELNSDDGNVVWSKELGANSNGEEYIFHSMAYVNLRPRITGIVKKDNKWTLFRFTMNSAGTIESLEHFDIPLPIDNTSFSTITALGEMIALSANDHSNALTIIWDSPEQFYNWSNQYTGASKKLFVTAMDKTFDGGVLATANAEDAALNKDILTIKTDSAGVLQGCNVTPVRLSTQTDYLVPTTDGTVTVLPDVLQEQTNSLTTNEAAIDSVVYCRQLYCKTFEENSCVSTFAKRYDSYGHVVLGTSFQITDDGFIVSGIKRDNAYDSRDDGSFMAALDKKGNVVKSLGFSNSNFTLFKTLQTGDGNFLSVMNGYVGTNATITLYKHDQQLNELWQKTYTNPLPIYDCRGVTNDAQGNTYAYFSFTINNTSFTYQLAVMKFDSQGNFLWMKTYATGREFSVLQFGSIVADSNGNLFITTEENNNQTFLLKLSSENGNIIWTKRYSNSTDDVELAFTLLLAGNKVMMHGVLHTKNNNTFPMYVLVDNEGNTLYSRLIHAFNADLFYSFGICLNNDNGFTISSIYATDAQLGQSLYVLDSALHVVQATYYDRLSVFTDLRRDKFDNLYELSYERKPDPYYNSSIFKKYSPDGSLGDCPGYAIAVKDSALTLLTDMVSFKTANNADVHPVAATFLPQQYAVSVTEILCGGADNCSSIAISGNNKVCSLKDRYIYKFKKNTGCRLQPKLLFDGTQVKMLAITDSSATVQFIKGGNIKLKVAINNGCKEFADSMMVNVSPDAQSFDIGKDTLICNGNAVLLNAGEGFAAYDWQDHSVKPTFNATKPGVYFVKVTNACNEQLSDTIHILADTLPAVDLGPDVITKCNHDSVALQVADAFLQYLWLPQTAITNVSNGVVKVYPDVNTQYTIRTVKANGCTTADSVIVMVKNSPQINLGADTSICQNQVLVLHAGAGFNSYQWNTGETTPDITVSQQGKYTIRATAANGCTSYDTLTLMEVHQLPAFTLGNDTALCENTRLLYNFRLTDATYLWSNGSIASQQVIDHAGTYWLAVSQTGCTRYDTVNIAYKPAPVVTLGNDTTLCEGTQKWLDASNNNATYNWQDHSTQPQFLVQQAGLYYVSVAINNCEVRDSIRINYTPKPRFELGKDAFLCKGVSLRLSPTPNTTVDYRWQDGSTQPSFVANDGGTYTLSAINQCGSFTDSIHITRQLCKLMMPSAFTPNKDGLNDVFKVKYPFPVKQFYLAVYNRFGQLVYESRDMLKGWDGTFNSQAQDAGTYIWKVNLTDVDNTVETANGTVVLIR